MSEQARIGGLPVPSPAGPGHRLVGLDGARGIACLSVILAHVMVYFAPGTMAAARLDLVLGHGVTFFFVLSGFLLYLPYVSRLASGRACPDASRYLQRRVLRIFPAYIAIFLIANFGMHAVYRENPFISGWANRTNSSGMITDFHSLIANLTLTHTFFPSTLQTGVNPSWTLSVEWVFYLLLPVIGYVLFTRATAGSRPLTTALMPVAALFATGLIAQVVLVVLQRTYYPDNALASYWGQNWTAVLSCSFFAFADVFALGMCCAVAYVAIVNGWLASWPIQRVRVTVLSGAVVGLLATAVLLATGSRFVETAIALVSAAVILLIVAPQARNEHSAVATAFNWRPVRAFGVISLSAFLWHYPVLIVVDRLRLPISDSAVGALAAFLLVTAPTVILATVTYITVEKPFIRLVR